MSTATSDPTTDLASHKQIRDDPDTRDECGCFDGLPACVGCTHSEAQQKLDASVHDLLSRSSIPAEGPHIVTEAADTHAMYLDGQLVGVAHTRDDAEATLQELIDEIAWQTRVETADIAAERAALLLEVMR
jgi:hypothetical protein